MKRKSVRVDGFLLIWYYQRSSRTKEEGRIAVPNIEIYGLNVFHQAAEEIDLARRIHQLFKNKPYAGEVVVTIQGHPTFVLDHLDNNQPFLRLITTANDKEAAEIIKLLQTLGMDIEHIVAAGFYPAKK